MEFTVIFPKLSYYEGKGMEDQRHQLEVYRKWIDELMSYNHTLSVFIEDTLGMKILKQLGYTYKTKTLTDQADYVFLKETGYDEAPVDIISNWATAELVETAATKKYSITSLSNVPWTKRIEARRQLFNDRLYYAWNVVATCKCKNMLCFRSANSNHFSDITDSLSVGDGRTYIGIDVGTGVPNIYYGGFWIEEEVFKTILKRME